MKRLTDRRFSQAEPILLKYKNKLDAGKLTNVSFLENELKECWDVGYQNLKLIFEDLALRDDYFYLAVFYRENSGQGSGVASEFQSGLARIYGIKDYNSDEREEAKKAFWAKQSKNC